jgi:hypothetical protein
MLQSSTLRVGTTAAVALALIAIAVPAQAQGQQRRRQPGWPCTGTIDPVYVRSAEATGGTVMLFTSKEIAGAADEMSASTRHRAVVLRAAGQAPEGVYEFEVPIDSTVESAYFFVSMQCLQSVSVIRPSGDELPTDAEGVEYHRFDAIRLFTVPEPTPGLWKLRLTGRGFYSVIVKAKTELRLAGVTFPPGGPVRRQATPQRLEVSTTGEGSDVEFRFISLNAATIEGVNLAIEDERADHRTYAGDVTPPETEFRVAMTGTDAKGFRFQRIQERLVVPDR